jgi:hypothetical protein
VNTATPTLSFSSINKKTLSKGSTIPKKTMTFQSTNLPQILTKESPISARPEVRVRMEKDTQRRKALYNTK